MQLGPLTVRIHPDPKEEFSLNVLNNSPGKEAISFVMTKLEMAKDIHLQTGKKLPFANVKCFATAKKNSTISVVWL